MRRVLENSLFLALLGAVFFFCSPRVMALEVKEVSVYVEISDDVAKACQFSKESVVAEIESAIRSNGIKVKSMYEAKGPNFFAHLFGSSEGIHCHGNGLVQVTTFLQNPKLPWTKALVKGGSFEHCLRTFNFYNVTKGHALQQAINSAFSNMTKICVSELLRE